MLGLCACLAFLTLFSVPERQSDQQLFSGLGDKSGYGDVQQGCGRAQLLLAAALRCNSWLRRRLAKVLSLEAIALPFVTKTFSDDLHCCRSIFHGALTDHGIDRIRSFTGLGSGNVKECNDMFNGWHNKDRGGTLPVLIACGGRRTDTGKRLVYGRLLWVRYLCGSKLVHIGSELLQQPLHLGTLRAKSLEGRCRFAEALKRLLLRRGGGAGSAGGDFASSPTCRRTFSMRAICSANSADWAWTSLIFSEVASACDCSSTSLAC